MKKLNFLAKTFSLLLVLMLSAHFGELNAQSFITEDQALTKLSTKLDQLSKTPNSSLSFPSGAKVSGDVYNSLRTSYYSMILQNLQTKDQAGNIHSTKSAFEATKALFATREGSQSSDPKSDVAGGLSWLHNEALQYLTH